MRHCYGILLLAAISVFVLCEVSAIEPQLRILGGKLAPQDVGIFQVSIFNKKHRHYCGGAIIRQNWIATAAHCFTVCGEGLKCAVKYATQNRLDKGRIAPIRLFITHPKHPKDATQGTNYDVALVEAPLILDQLAQPIPIIDVDIPFYAAMETSGFGWTKNANHTCTRDLKITDLKRVQCPMSLAPTFICTLGANTNPCHGDSGGPLTYKGKLVGVTGFGAKIPSFDGPQMKSLQKKPIFSQRCHPGVVGNFGYLYYFRDWINETIHDYTLKYDLNNLTHKEWDDAYLDREYGFNRSSPIFC